MLPNLTDLLSSNLRCIVSSFSFPFPTCADGMIAPQNLYQAVSSNHMESGNQFADCG